MKKSANVPEVKTPATFPIVAIGASSGGLEAVTELLKNLAPNTGMSYIFIQHLSPNHESLLTPLLAKSTKMKVQEIEDMEQMLPDNLYVIPYNKGIEVTDGHIQLIPRTAKSPNLSIDVLFRSLAETHGEGAIGVVLSGNATDGTQGLRAIKEYGGITFAQDNSAKYGSMPESAINEGVADFILSPKEIAKELGRISKHETVKSLKINIVDSIEDNDPDLKVIINLLHQSTGIEFTHYKMGTIKRRINRRMSLFKLHTLKQYVKRLKDDDGEVRMLYSDLLIHVTDFFRDGVSFDYLKSTLLPRILGDKKPGEKLRIWVTACSTGQEAYSMAMLVIESLGAKHADMQVQIFGSDLSADAIRKARIGEYTPEEVRSVSPKRLARFFTKVGENYKVAKSVRDMCAFAPHNILSDPPFSRLDLITCCNLLIYLTSAVQKRIMATFHYALNDSGYLMLGKAETIGTSPLFAPIEGKFRIYTRNKGLRTLPALISRTPQVIVPKKEDTAIPKKIIKTIHNEGEINAILFENYTPAYVVINANKEITQFKGATANYLNHSTGQASFNIFKMVRPEISFDLRNAIQKALATNAKVHKPDIEIQHGKELRKVTIDVVPLDGGGEDKLVVIFREQMQEVWVEKQINGEADSSPQNGTIARLKEELAQARAELMSIYEHKESANNILQTANEEMLSSNEEFQSMNEELETSKEETECANEELITTNHELQMRNVQLAEANDFSEAIITTLHEPMLILDKMLRVKSCNNAFCKKFLVQQTDIEGKLLYEIGRGQWDIPRLRKLLENLIRKNSFFYDYEITHVFPGIGSRTMLLNGKHLIQKGQDEKLILLAFIDVTEKHRERIAEKKELEDIIAARTKDLAQSRDTLVEKNKVLEKMNKELETFTFISSHDLQEPLRQIQNFTACLLAEEKKGLTQDGKHYLNRMQTSVTRMQRLIEDLLSYSRVKNVKDKAEVLDLNYVAREVLLDFKDTMDEKGIIINVQGKCRIKIIPYQMRQVLHNLISNAIKFAHTGRSLEITIKCEVATGKKLGNTDLLSKVKYCHLAVEDNGIGFEPQYKDRIFEVFQRLHQYDEYKGTGIGLAICKRIVENYGGVITASGKPGEGASFDIYIPAEI